MRLPLQRGREDRREGKYKNLAIERFVEISYKLKRIGIKPGAIETWGRQFDELRFQRPRLQFHQLSEVKGPWPWVRGPWSESWLWFLFPLWPGKMPPHSWLQCICLLNDHIELIQGFLTLSVPGSLGQQTGEANGPPSQNHVFKSIK